MGTTSILVEKNKPCTMRDGTTLYADIYRPYQEGKFPVLLTRLPYGKDLPYYSHRYLDTNRLVEHGYIVIIQDVRGRYHSEGEFIMFENEAEDGYDTVEWAASLPYSTGKVGMFGLSYYAFTQLLAATERPPHLCAIFPAQTLNDPRNGSTYQNGALGVGLFETMALGSIAGDLIKRKYKEPELYEHKIRILAKALNDIDIWYRHSPLNELPPLIELGVGEHFFATLAMDLEDKAWERVSITDKYHQINVPAYHVAGWYDCLLNSTLENYAQLTKKSGSSESRKHQKLLIGPWAHGDFGSVIGERSFGVHASEEWIDLQTDLTELHCRWFDYWLKRKAVESIDNEAPVKLFVMGTNKWRDEQEWPLARTIYTPFYLHSSGGANTLHGDGTLSMNLPNCEPVDQFLYDPENPVPTHGGGTLFEGVRTTGPQDQRGIEERKDVLVYSSDPLKEALEATGPVKVQLWATTDAKDTDFTAKLIDVLPDGTAYNLTDGIVRARYRNGYEKADDLEGQIVKYEIDLWATSNVFLPGHRIRLEISSSNFPRFDVNPNTGHTLVNTKDMKAAKQVIYHTTEYPSQLILPVIPN